MADIQQQIESAILGGLKLIREPGGKDLVESGVVAEVRGEDSGLLVVCRHTNWPEPIRQRLEREIRTVILARLPQLETIRVEWRPVGEAAAPAASGAATGGSLPAPDIKHIVAVGSGKGGVGKSTIAASLAYGLKLRGYSVGLMDADVYGPSIPHMVGLTGQQPRVVDNRYVPPEVDGIKCISMGFLVPAEQAVVWRGPMLHKAVRDFLYLVDWGSLDYLIVDLPPGTGDIVLSLSQQMPLAGGVIVCTPQDVALLDARKALNMFQTVKIPCLGIVENMSFFVCPKCSARTEIFGHGGAEHWADEAGVPFLGGVPIQLQVRINGDSGGLRQNFADDNPVRNNLLAICDRLIQQVESRGEPALPQLEIVE